MSVELISTRTSASEMANKFPALLNPDSQTGVKCEDKIPGSYHCLVSLVEGQLVVWDLGAPGGTLVNGMRVNKSAVKPGDTLSLAGSSFQVNYQPRHQRYLHGARS